MTLLTRTIRNGVDAEQLSALCGRVEKEPECAVLGYRAANRWIDGTHSVSAVGAIDGAEPRTHSFRLDADAPAGLLGTDRAPDPSELLLHALAACLTRSVVHLATTRGVELATVESAVSGAVDVRRLLGLPGGAGLGHIGATVRVTGDAPVAELVALADDAAAASPVHAALTRGVRVALRVAAA